MAASTATAYKTLKATLDNIVKDDSDGIASNLVCAKYMRVESMSDAYVDDLERGGLGLATEKAEGQTLDTLDFQEGALYRYTARKFGLISELTEELDEDGKYNDQYVDLSRQQKQAVYKTLEVDCANVLNRAFNASYVGGDGVALASASHTIPGGGTFSNTLSTPFSPSVAALAVVIQNAMLLPDHDGIVGSGAQVKKVVHPVAQWGAWKEILKSEKRPDSLNAHNVVGDMGIQQVPVTYWTASTTNWGVITDAPHGLKLKWRRKPKSRTWYDEPTEVIKHGTSARWARGWSNPRGFYGSNA